MDKSDDKLQKILGSVPDTSVVNDQDDNLSSLNIAEQNARTLELKNKRLEQDTDCKKDLTNWTMLVISIYLIIVMSILIFHFCFFSIPLSDAVLITLLTTTTTSVLGMMLIVLKCYFKNN